MSQLLVAQAERQATVSMWEDLHWADPSSLEFLALLIEQLPTSKLLLVLITQASAAETEGTQAASDVTTVSRTGRTAGHRVDVGRFALGGPVIIRVLGVVNRTTPDQQVAAGIDHSSFRRRNRRNAGCKRCHNC